MRNRGKVTAADLAARLDRDPTYQAKLAAQAKQAELIRTAERALLDQLGRLGHHAGTFEDLVAGAVPLPLDLADALLQQLARIEQPGLQETVVRALGTCPPGGLNGKPLVDLFEQTASDTLRWAIANTLAEARPTEVAGWILTALRDERLGTAREMLALAAARTSPPEAANEALLALLADLPGHAALALAECGTAGELPALEAAYARASGWERVQLGRTINVIRRRSQEAQT